MSTLQASGENFASNPAQYVKRVNAHTGQEVPGPIDPDELLIHSYRDRHPLEVAAQFLASRTIYLTGSEGVARQGLRVVNTVGSLMAQAIGTPSRSAAAAYDLAHKNERRKGRGTSSTGLAVVK